MRAVGNGWDMDDHEETREALLSHYLSLYGAERVDEFERAYKDGFDERIAPS